MKLHTGESDDLNDLLGEEKKVDSGGETRIEVTKDSEVDEDLEVRVCGDDNDVAVGGQKEVVAGGGDDLEGQTGGGKDVGINWSDYNSDFGVEYKFEEHGNPCHTNEETDSGWGVSRVEDTSEGSYSEEEEVSSNH